MDVFEAIAERHSYRGPFADKPVPREDLRKIVEAGILAPSGKNAQTTTFVVIDSPQVLAEARRIIDRPVCKTAQAMIVCVADPQPVMGKHSFHREDCAAAVENILLAVTALGYATVWLDGALRVNMVAERLANLLGVPPTRQVRVVLPLGVPTQPGEPKPKLPFEQRAWFNRYGA